jgi:thiol-disulfide isomerase/thioredoxin
MIRAVLAAVLLAASLLAQQEMSAEEQEHLRQVLAESSSSAVDLIHALETHLAKYPDSPKKHDLDRAILKAAIQANDAGRIATYGERVLKQEPDDVTILDPVSKALVLSRVEDKMKSGLEWSKKYEAAVRGLMRELAGETADRGRRKDELDRMLGNALLYEAIASGLLGDQKAGAEAARKSFEAYPAADPALELGRRLAALGKVDEAIRAYAGAFTIPDSRATDADRVEIRRRLGELYQKAKGSEAGLGDVVLQAFDRNTALLAERRLALKQFDPNHGVTNPMEFTLNSVKGEKLPLSTLSGKVVVMDFWATWCGPCRVQHPLYDQVKQRFASNQNVVFLAIDTDEDRGMVKPFVEEQGWTHAVYYESGLARTLRVSSIPTTIVFGRSGAVVTRMNGFDPESFVDVLTDRIKEALAGDPGKGGQ